MKKVFSTIFVGLIFLACTSSKIQAQDSLASQIFSTQNHGCLTNAIYNAFVEYLINTKRFAPTSTTLLRTSSFIKPSMLFEFLNQNRSKQKSLTTSDWQLIQIAIFLFFKLAIENSKFAHKALKKIKCEKFIQSIDLETLNWVSTLFNLSFYAKVTLLKNL